MNKDELILKALKGSLNTEEKVLFDHLLATDEAFKNAFDYEQDVKAAVQLEERILLKNKLREHDAKPRLTIWYWAAAAILLMALSFGIWSVFQSSTGQDLYAQNYQKFPNLVAPNTRAADDLNEKEKAYKAYDTGDYERAFQSLIALSDDQANFYAGICLIEMGKLSQATMHFEAISFGDEFENHRLWYLSLLYVQQNEFIKAEPILKYLTEGQSVWREKATNLLDKIK